MSKGIDEQATDITIATMQSLELKFDITRELNVKALTELMSEVYKTAYKTIGDSLSD